MSLYLYDIIDEYINYQENRSKSQEISHIYFREIKRYLIRLKDNTSDKPICKLKYRDIEFLKNKLAASYAPKTVNKWLYEVKSFLKWCVLMEYLENTNAGNVRGIKSQRNNINPFNLEDINQALATLKGINTTIYLLVATAFYTGMRPSELLAMRWESLCTKTWSYEVDSAMVDGKIKSTKTNRTRIVHFIQPLQEAFNERGVINRKGFIFTNQYGRPYTTMCNINKNYWKPVLKSLNIDYRPIHKCRHTYTVLSIQAGEDLNFISNQLGHTSLEMLIKHYGSYIQRFHPKRVLKIENLFINHLQRELIS